MYRISCCKREAPHEISSRFAISILVSRSHEPGCRRLDIVLLAAAIPTKIAQLIAAILLQIL